MSASEPSDPRQIPPSYVCAAVGHQHDPVEETAVVRDGDDRAVVVLEVEPVEHEAAAERLRQAAGGEERDWGHGGG